MTKTNNRRSIEPTSSLDEVHRWWRKPHWQLLLVIIFILVAIVAVQCFYPYGKSMPTARIGDVPVGGMNQEEIIDTLHETFTAVPLIVNIPQAEPLEITSVEAGIVPEYQGAAESVTEYPLSQRLIPFSFIGELVSSQKQLPYAIEPELFQSFASIVAEACERPTKDATLSFTEGKVLLISSEDGQQCSESAIMDSLLSSVLHRDGVDIEVTPEVVAPILSDDELRPALRSAEAIINKGLIIATPAEKWQVPVVEVASWLTVDESGGLRTEAVKIKEYLKKQRGTLYIEPGTTTVRIVDGREVSRTEGSSGQGIDLAITEGRISDVLLGNNPEPTAWVQLTVLPPREVIRRDYSSSHKGLQALLVQWDREHSGRYGIVVRDLSGKGWNADLNGGQDFVTASTYKMFLAYAVLEKIEKGELTMNTKTNIGLGVRECIDEMIVHSTNACATALFDLVGWSYVHHFILEQFPSTRLDNGANADGDKHTTTRDEAVFLERLNAGQLLDKQNTNYLLSLMKKQIYRGGIPAGVPGITVADKIGFYAGYKHDVGIVYAPSGTYILSIMSYGGADWEFADLSRKVYDLMKRR